MAADTTLGDLFKSWTAAAALTFDLVILGAAVFGLVLSLMAFVAMYRRVVESNGEVVPWGPMAGVAIAGLISVVGLIYGFSSLFWAPAA